MACRTGGGRWFTHDFIAVLVKLHHVLHVAYDLRAVYGRRVATRRSIACTIIHAIGYVGIMRLVEFSMVFLECGVAHNRLYEISAYRQCRAAALSQGTRAEVDAAVFSAYPCATDKFRTDTHEPCVGMVVGGSGLSSEVGITRRIGIGPKAL